MGYRTLVLWVGCTLLSTAYAQPAIDWQRHYGGSLPEQAYSITTTADGGYILLSETRSSDGLVAGFHGGVTADLWVMKLDHDGMIQWQRCLGGSGPETAGEIQQTQDGGYVIVGSTASLDGDVSENLGGTDIWLVRLNADGTLLWEKSYGGSAVDVGEQVSVRPDGSYMIMGFSFSHDGDISGDHGASDFWLGHVDDDGVLQQSRCYGGSANDHPRVMRHYADGVTLFGGVTNSIDGDLEGTTGSNDAWVAYMADGWNITWQTVLGGAGDDQAYGLLRAEGDTVFVAILTNSQDGDISASFGYYDYWVAKLDPDGTLLRQRSFGGSGLDHPRTILGADDGRSLYVTGFSNSNDGLVSSPRGGNDCWLLQLSSDLDLVWETSLGGTSGESGNALCIAAGGGLVVAGYSSSSDGHVTGNYGFSDVWVVKLQPDDVGMGEAHVASPLRLYPNPATQLLNLVWEASATTLLVHDAQGRLVTAQERLPAGQRQVQLNVEGWADGLYTVQLMGADQRQVQRFAKH